MKRSLHVFLGAIIIMTAAFTCLPPVPAQAAGLAILSRTPAVNALNVMVSSDITVTFSADINPATVNATSFNVNGSISGRIAGAYDVTGTTVTFNPAADFKVGETIYVTLTAGIQDTGPNTLASSVMWQFTIVAGAGCGYFTTYATFGGGTDKTFSLAVGDFNGDGRLDIVQGSNPGVSTVCLNNGAGGFSYGYFGNGGDKTPSLAVGDFNNDGCLDVVQGIDTGQSKVWFNDGSGNFTTSADLGGAGDNTWALAGGDLNGDGYFDIVQGFEWGQSKVWFNNGSGNFTTSANFGGAADSTYTLAVGDFNGDGYPDIVQGLFSGQSCVWFNNGSGSFLTNSNFGGGDITLSVSAGDFNGDGSLDIVQCINGQSKVWFNDGAGSFPTKSDFGNSSNRNYALAVGDFNGDGSLDIALGKFWVQSRVWFNDGSGGFFTSEDIGDFSDNTRTLAMGDFNGDGSLDIVQGINNGRSMVLFNNKPVIGLWQGAAAFTNGGSYLFNTNTDVVFTIRNTGVGNLGLTLPFTISGADAGQFSISASAASPVAVSGNTTFTVRFTPTGSGSKTAVLTINSNDPVKPAYTITLTGTGFAPGLNLKHGASAIANGSGNDFGSQVTGTFVDTVFTIENTGTSNLTLTLPFNISGANAGQFSIVSSAAAVVTPSGSTTFTIRFASTALGARTATLEITSNDPTNGVYTVTLTGTGTAASSGGGGGGGGEAIYTSTMNIMGKQAGFSISSSGKISGTAAVTSNDGSLSLTLPGGTMALESDGTRLDGLTCNCMDNPPPPPADASIIGLPYRFGPEGAVFAPAITLTFKYDPAKLPAGFDEANLKVAWYDKSTGQWIALACSVDPATNTIKAGISHFSDYAVIAFNTAPVPVPTVTVTITSPAVTVTVPEPAVTIPGPTVTVIQKEVTTVTVPAPVQTNPPASTTAAGAKQSFFSLPVVILIIIGALILAAIIFIARNIIWRHQGM